MVKTTINISPDQVEKIDMLALAKDLSREEIINQAIASFLKNQSKEPNSDPLEKHFKEDLEESDWQENPPCVFGLLKEQKIDSIKFQQQIRSEW